MADLEPIEPSLRRDETLDPAAHVVVRGWPLHVDGLMRNADATRSRFQFRGSPLAAVSAEVTVATWTVDTILAGPRLRTRSRYAAAQVGDLVRAGFALLPTFVSPHYSIVLDPYTAERAEALLQVLGTVRVNPHHVRRQP